MPRQIMMNSLELAFSPVSNYVFSLIKKDENFRRLTKDSNLYVIAQRGELTFDALYFEPEEHNKLSCVFEIRQKGNPSILHCKLPIFQPNLIQDVRRNLQFGFEYGIPKPSPIPKTFPQNNIINLLFSYHDGEFVSWLCPENFIQNYLNGAISADVEGDINDFINYKVHYVGKATEQEVWKRLTGHSALQDILSVEYPFTYGTLPTHEIAILFFKLQDSIAYHTIFADDNISPEFVDSLMLMAENYPQRKTIALDAEKALINAMQPKYNREFYKGYPKSKDGLYKYGLDSYRYMIGSDITLIYDNGKIKGLRNPLKADAIIIEKDQPLRIIENNDD